MAGRRHSKNTIITVDSDDLSAYTNASDIETTADSHDTTTYGAAAHRYEGGLFDGTFKMSGFYENGTSGPAAVLKPLLGTTIAVVRKVEGTGSGKPSEAFDALLTKYAESAPVADYITWSAEFQLCTVVTTTTQS